MENKETKKRNIPKKVPYLGRRIRDIRIRGNIRQAEFGKILGITQSKVAKIEDTVEPSLGVLIKIANFGNVSLDWLADTEKSNLSESRTIMEVGKFDLEQIKKYFIRPAITGLDAFEKLPEGKSGACEDNDGNVIVSGDKNREIFTAILDLAAHTDSFRMENETLREALKKEKETAKKLLSRINEMEAKNAKKI